jgi:hypothetical protein
MKNKANVNEWLAVKELSEDYLRKIPSFLPYNNINSRQNLKISKLRLNILCPRRITLHKCTVSTVHIEKEMLNCHYISYTPVIFIYL